ncbi:MAG: PIN domain-containing protein [Micromonosporaceae bacterium]
MNEIVYDAGALIAMEGSRSRAALARHRRFLAEDYRVMVPSVVAAQVVRDPPRQAPLMRVLRGCDVVPFGEDDYGPVGRLLAESGTSDVADGFVALTAARRQATVITSDRARIAALLGTLRAPLPVLEP